MKIPLFDLDGTLLQNGGVSSHLIDAYSLAMKTVYHLPQASLGDKETVQDGFIQNQSLLALAMKYGYTKEEALEKIPKASKIIGEYFLTHKQRENSLAHTGAKELLEFLQQHTIRSGVLTGNSEVIGWEKLQQAGLKKYISFGAFGNEAVRRVDLIPIAQKKYQEVFGEEKLITDFVIIGDTPNDIFCAQEGGIPVIAVPTGNYSKEELSKEKPDLLVESLEEKEKILTFLQSE